jgi:hypothetical protein
MLGRFDRVGSQIIVEDVFGGPSKAEEDASTSIRERLVGAPRTRGKCIDATAKSPKVGKKGLGTTAKFKWRLGIVTMNSDVVQAKMVMKGVGPEMGLQISATEHGTKRITDGLMRALARGVLMRGIWSSRLNSVPSIREELNDFRRMAELTTKIKPNIAIRNIASGRVLSEPAIDEISRGTFGAEGLTIKCTTVMINNEAIASLTIDTLEALLTS